MRKVTLASLTAGSVAGPLVAAALVLLVPAILLSGCAEGKAPSESEFRTHPPEWTQVSSVDFHGLGIGERDPSGCETCHGVDLRGEIDTPSCYKCHNGPGGHSYSWSDPAEAGFHGNDVAALGPQPCQTCHGDEYRGGWSETSCYSCHAGGPSGHPDGWMIEVSSAFHGRRATQEGFADCRRCHGNNLDGGTSEVSCASCHVDGIDGGSRP